MIQANEHNVGVIIGRFQTPCLHEAHIDLIQHVVDHHPKVYIILGKSPVFSATNPFDFDIRRGMINQKFPDVNIFQIEDIPGDDARWSKHLDATLRSLISIQDKPLLYGSRDSFIPYYLGNFPTMVLESKNFEGVSATRQRACAAARSINSFDFRAGVVYGVNCRYPVAYTTVDIAIVDYVIDHVLMARKPGFKKWRFPGGFSDIGSETFEEDAIRETQEETGLIISEVRYIGSTKIDDPRYRGLPDQCIKTLLFVGTYMGGTPRAADDIDEVTWMDIRTLDTRMDEIDPIHHPLVKCFLANEAKRRETK